MKKASVHDLGQESKKIKRPPTQRRQAPIEQGPQVRGANENPDFLARLHSIYGDKTLAETGAELISSDRD
jgi:hypothetical protein